MHSSSAPCHWMTFHWKCALQLTPVGVQCAGANTHPGYCAIAGANAHQLHMLLRRCPLLSMQCRRRADGFECGVGGDRTANDSRGIPNLLPKCLYKRRRMSVVKLGSNVTVTRSEVKISTNFEISLSQYTSCLSPAPQLPCFFVTLCLEASHLRSICSSLDRSLVFSTCSKEQLRRQVYFVPTRSGTPSVCARLEPSATSHALFPLVPSCQKDE